MQLSKTCSNHVFRVTQWQLITYLKISFAALHYVLQTSVREFSTEREVEFFKKLTSHSTRIDIACERCNTSIGEFYAAGKR